MKLYRVFFFSVCLLLSCNYGFSQDTIRSELFYGFIFNHKFEQVPHTAIINLNSRKATISDRLGYFEIQAREGDHILLKNISFNDTILRISSYKKGMLIKMSARFHPINEVKIFQWGNSYGDFTEALLQMPKQIPVGVKMGITKEDFDRTPFYLKEEILRNPRKMWKNPISFLYYNLSRREKIIRKAHKYKLDTEKREYLKALLSRENIQEITQLENEELSEFIFYLNSNIRCDHNCKELELISEIYFWWKEYMKNK